MSAWLRWAGYLVILAGAAALYAGYDPPLVATYWPAAAPFAQQIHGYLPVALTGAPAAPSAPPAAPSRPPVSVLVAPAVRKDVPWKIDEIGTAQAIASVALRPHFDATVEKVLVADGAAVKAGDTADRARRRGRRVAQLDGAKAQLAKDEAQLEQAQRDVTRYTDLVARSATPVLNLDNAKTAVATAKAAILADKAAIDNLQVQLGWYTIDAPISGRVGVVAIKEGNIAKAGDNGATGIFATINQISPIYVTFSVSNRCCRRCARRWRTARRSSRRRRGRRRAPRASSRSSTIRSTQHRHDRRARDLRQRRREAVARSAVQSHS